MTDRRRPAVPMMQAGSPAYNRLAAMLEKQGADHAERLEAFFDRMGNRMDRLERDVGALDMRHGDTTSRLLREIDELRRDVGETRDAVAIGDGRRTKAAAEGAAAGATQAAAVVAEKVAHSGVSHLPKTWWGRTLIAATGFTTIMVAADKLPDAARGMEKFWLFIRGDSQPQVESKRAEK